MCWCDQNLISEMRISVSGLEVSQVKAVLSQRATARAAPEDIAGPKSGSRKNSSMNIIKSHWPTNRKGGLH